MADGVGEGRGADALSNDATAAATTPHKAVRWRPKVGQGFTVTLDTLSSCVSVKPTLYCPIARHGAQRPRPGVPAPKAGARRPGHAARTGADGAEVPVQLRVTPGGLTTRPGWVQGGHRTALLAAPAVCGGGARRLRHLLHAQRHLSDRVGTRRHRKPPASAEMPEIRLKRLKTISESGRW